MQGQCLSAVGPQSEEPKVLLKIQTLRTLPRPPEAGSNHYGNEIP